MNVQRISLVCFSLISTLFLVACQDGDGNIIDGPVPLNPDTAVEVSIDRFSEAAGNLMVRTDSNGLPGPNEPIDFDSGEPFITQGVGPDGEVTTYYNFDVQSEHSAPIFVLFREGEDTPVEGQLNIIGVIPGDDGYSDFWHVHRVTVGPGYVVNTLTSVSDVMSSGYAIERTNLIVNCPVIPEGSTASLRLGGGDNGLIRGWYEGQVVYYFDFSERELRVTLPDAGHPNVPVSDILVTFNVNPDQPDGGPASGFMTENGSVLTHNVLETLPDDADYSPLWHVDVYDNADFHAVHDYESATAANILAEGVALVNCPVVDIDGQLALNPNTAPEVIVDRFSEAAGTLMVRTDTNGLPAANEPVDFDSGQPFITQGLGPDGEVTKYYNFDVQPEHSAPIFVLFREGEDTPVQGQLNIIDVVPGDDGYSDFWHVHHVTVDADYVANTVTNLSDLMAAGFTIERTNRIVNCPVVPKGSTASLRYGGGNNGLVKGWYKDQVVYYFDFSEKRITVTLPEAGHPDVPVSEILVTFNINPDQPGGGPASGFMTEAGTVQTHNALETLPDDAGYSPLWDVDVYDNADFDSVQDYPTAQAANILAEGVALVNCPVVSVSETAGLNPNTAPEVSVDRFSQAAGTLMVRTDTNGLPAANTPIDYDTGEPFVTQGLGPNGEIATYYNFDVQPEHSAPIFVLFRQGESEPVEGQLNIIGVVPGDDGYSDFWHVHKVTVDPAYVPNTLTNIGDVVASGYPIERTNLIVNCPVVPKGSSASRRFGPGNNGLVKGWYEDQVVYYFDFSEKQITVELPETGHPDVPLSDILVTFNINPDMPGGGPASGFMTETGTVQAHNVLETLPFDAGYSPLWHVDVYDNADFGSVHDFASALEANILAEGVATVNCPVVSVR